MSTRMPSYWEQTQSRTLYPALEKEIRTAVLVIGGGITGVSCAYQLAKAGVSVALAEAGTLGCGATGHSTGKVSALHGEFYAPIAKAMGKETAGKAARTQREAVESVKRFALNSDRDCGFAESDAFFFARTEKERQKVEAEAETLRAVGLDARFVPHPDFPPQAVGAAVLFGQAVIHPLRYLSALADAAAGLGARIFEHTTVTHIRNGREIRAYCSGGVCIDAHHLIDATQYPAFGVYFTRLYPRRSYAIAVEPKRAWPSGSYISADDSPARSLRTVREGEKNVLVAAGDGNITGRDDGKTDSGPHFEALKKYAEQIAGPFSLRAAWSAQDYETPDGLPYIGPVSPGSNLYIASGFNKWGLSGGTLAGIVLTEWITDGSSVRGEPYSPLRFRPAGVVPMVEELSGQMGALLRSKTKKAERRAEELAPGEGGIVRFEGRKAGAFRHPDGTLTVLDIACTHLGCTLSWNETEHSWDCPCHGGRFDAEGRRLEGPPPRNLPVLYRGGGAGPAKTSRADTRPSA